MTRRAMDPLVYYASHSPITDPGTSAGLFQELPVEIPALCKILQGILMHHCSAELRGVELSDERREEQELRWVARMLARIVELDDRPLLEARQPDRRLAVCCRDFATLLCAMLRHRGVPARARCGFAAYFRDGPNLAADFYVDHWVCEYWNAGERRWVLVDAEIDEVERQHYQIQIDTLDLPHDQFLLAGRAWQLCRSGQADPERFGLGPDGMRGLWYIQSQVVRDLAALNKMELLCWDCWGLGDRGPDEEVSGEEHARLDRVAALTQQATGAFAELRVLYETDPQLSVPPVINSYTRKGVRRIDLTAS